MKHRTEVTNRAPLYRPSLRRPLTHRPTGACPGSGLTVGGTPGRRSCWGSPGGRCGCLPAPRCTAAAPAPERHPACRTAKVERAMGRRGWASGSSQPRISGLGDPPHQATRINPVRSQLRVQVIPLLHLVALASPGWKLGLLPCRLPLPHFLSITSSKAPASRISPNPPTSLHWPSSLPSTRHPLLLPRQSPPQPPTWSSHPILPLPSSPHSVSKV